MHCANVASMLSSHDMEQKDSAIICLNGTNVVGMDWKTEKVQKEATLLSLSLSLSLNFSAKQRIKE